MKMVSRTVLCLALFALVAVCYSAPYQGNKKIVCSKSDSNSNSNESNEPCDLNPKQQKKNLQIQDSSSSESEENRGKPMKVKISQEENNSKEIRQAPAHQEMKQGNTGIHYQEVRPNVQKSRKGKNDNDSNEKYTYAEYNQIGRQTQ